MLSHIFKSTDVALLVISPAVFDIPDFNRLMLMLNRRLGDVGRRISEIRLIGDDESLIAKAIDELSRKFNIVFVSGAFGLHNNYRIAKIIAELFSVPLESLHNSVEIQLPRRAAILHKNGSEHFGFRFANLVCCDESLQCMDEVLEIIKCDLMKGHHFFTRQITTQMPFEKFAPQIEEIAGESGCECHIMREDGGAYKIILRHTEVAMVRNCEAKIMEFLYSFDGDFEVST